MQEQDDIKAFEPGLSVGFTSVKIISSYTIRPTSTMFPPTILSKLGLAAVASATVAEAIAINQIFNFTSYVSIENSIIRPNGHILL